MIDNLSEQLIRDEGEILHAYQDSLGYWTIGVGHLIDARKGGSIPQVVSRQLLALDISRATQGLLVALPWLKQLDEIRLAALVNMAFNMGVHNVLMFSKTLSLLREGKYAEAAGEMLNSVWATQVGDRANRLARQIETGEWQ